MTDEDESAALAHEQELEMQAHGLFHALAKARAEIKNPRFDRTNPHFKSKFASLAAVMDATLPVLARHGISVVQDLQTIEGGVACFTHVFHESGDRETFGPFVVPPTKGDAQGYASASTYARRYSLMAVTGVVGDEDDDGNAASESHFKSAQMKSKYYDGLKAAAADDDDLKARELWDEMDSEQQQEIWRALGPESRIRSTLKKLLERSKEAASA